MRTRIIIPAILLSLSASSQNLVVNPGAEDNPRGTGWIIASTGPAACGVAPSNTYLNWTMIPDGSGNYPPAHGGTRTFFSGCSATAPGGPFELYQDIDVTADAALIDAGNLTTTFSGFIQTPISPQADAGRFIVDFMTAANVVLGTSYTTPFQSFTGGSGTGWVNYSNTRIAPAGTRKIRIRIQTNVAVTPAINAYFDDISLTTASTLPLTLISFKGEGRTGHNDLEWSTSQESNTGYFAVERTTTAGNWTEIARVNAAGNSNSILNYSFRDQSPGAVNYYRLDERRNTELANILRDFVHERWAAKRTVNPQIWRCIGKFIDASFFPDIEKVFSSVNSLEKEAAALACYDSNYPPAKKLLDENAVLKQSIEKGKLSWNILAEKMIF